MARPISWLPSVREIHRSVCNSVRAFYERRDIETLFKIQPRSAQKIIELMPRTEVGLSLVVEREHLQAWLERIRDAENPAELLREIAKDPPPITRSKNRTVLRWEPPEIAPALPRTVQLRRGRLEVSFRTVRELAEALYAFSRTIDTEAGVHRFEREYCIEIEEPPKDTAAADDMRKLFEELEAMEQQRKVPQREAVA